MTRTELISAPASWTQCQICVIFFSSHILPNINKLMILADGERMLGVLCVVKYESMSTTSVVFCLNMQVCVVLLKIIFGLQ